MEGLHWQLSNDWRWQASAVFIAATGLFCAAYHRASSYPRIDGVPQLTQADLDGGGQSKGDDKLLPTGSIRQRSGSGPTGKTRLWIFPASLNSGKAHMCLRLSSAWEEAEVREIDIHAENYTEDFCRLNPNMSVPVLEIDDKIITDSRLIAAYLREHRPGAGEPLADQEHALVTFLDLVASWDEGLYSYGKGSQAGGVAGSLPALMNDLRLVRLRQNLRRARSAPEGERLVLAQAYFRKIAAITNFKEKTTAPTPEAMRANDEKLAAIMRETQGLLVAHGGPFLFGAKPCAADAFMSSLFARILDMFPEEAARVFRGHDRVEAYTKTLLASAEGRVVFGYGPSFAVKFLVVQRLMIVQLVLVKLGLARAPSLPAILEEAIAQGRTDVPQADFDRALGQFWA